jgi:signal transduction histidine kinase
MAAPARLLFGPIILLGTDMINALRNRLAIQQTAYAFLAIAGLAFLISVAQTGLQYRSERNQHGETIARQINILAKGAARAAFHIDQDHAATILDGAMRITSLAEARITTDQEFILAKRNRSFEPFFMDPVSRWLFGDIAIQTKQLKISRREMVGASPDTTSAAARRQVGTLFLRSSPEFLGQQLFRKISSVITALLIELLLAGAALAMIFHRTLTLPLLRYSESLTAMNFMEGKMPHAEIPKGHEHDELGQIVTRTNQLVERLKQEQEAVLHRDKVASLGALLAGVSHELNNPLAIVLAQTELLAETAPDDGVRDRAAKIRIPAERCVRIVETFLALAQQREFVKQSVSVDELISDTLGILDYQLRASRIKVALKIEKELPKIMADPTLISQAFLNILINAQQALTARTKQRAIRIEARHMVRKHMVDISFQDNGDGIPSELTKRVLEPFYTTKGFSKGTGLGLSYVRNITEMHGGTVTIGQADLGGALVRLSFPVAQASPAP